MKRDRHKPLTPDELAVEEMLSELMALPVGASRVFLDRAFDGFGGMVVKRHSAHTLVFQRQGFKARSRWADTHAEAREEIETYLDTGKLNEPDKIKGW